MKKILFITYYWPPSGGAGVQRGLKFVKYLPEFGVKPFVLTVDPEQASYPSLDASLLAEVPAGVEVIRTKSFEPLRILAAIGGKNAVPHAGFAGANKEGLIQRAMRWVRGNWMIPDARRGWVKYAVKAAAKVIEREKIGTIVISSPPHSSQLIGLELKKRFPMLRWIADLRDPWTDIYFTKELLKGARAKRLDAAYEAEVMRTADAVVVVGPSMKSSFAQRYGADVEKKISVITNGYDQRDMDRISKPLLSHDEFRITYVGTMAGSYDPRVFFKAISSLRGQVAVPIRLRFVGSVSSEVRTMADHEGVSDLCQWIPSVPHDDALREMAAAHMLLLVIPSGEGVERILTGKLFEYIGIGRPIIGIGPEKGDAAAIIHECRAGRIFDRSSEREMKDWIVANLDRTMDGVALLEKNGSHVKYERRNAAERLAGIIANFSR
ncbi:MAG: glycosyltransferase [Flavobacteriales bacterium]|nr:glycosyltransferase [Flavobacteriales bacterium]MBL0045091.1 glycosyltransferase [Flavobacteriales bacterium]